ncbi:putative ubx domain protein [Phaeomoniella chlamydospora]|uniref:Putative ubx domain protein n=1 Tax=Phaeomoniella chlamydospora TaxID=158046 RepID=A0A0G2EEK3_PHACM|nr:putative ubx domain protein [Phaeomoniella chlamydospora]
MSAPDIGQLSESQQLALQTYTSVTDQDPIAAIPLLQRSEWNVQIAIAKFFDGEQPDPVAEARASMDSLPSTSARRTQNLQYDNVSPSRTPRRPPGDTVTNVDLQSSHQPTYQAPLILSLLFTPFSILYRVISTVLSPLGTLFPFLPRLLSRFSPNGSTSRPGNTSGRRTLAPRDNAQRFIRELAEEYGTSAQSLPFIESGFNLTLDNAKSQLKYLLVVLLSPEHDDTSHWVRNTLLSTQFLTFVRDHGSEIVLWGGNVQDSEAYQVADQLRCTKFPFAALIVHTPDVSSSAMSVVCRAAGSTTPSELVAKLATAITANNEALTRLRAQRSEQQAQRNLRQEQDSAYERSLARDRERARQRREEEAARAAAEKAALEHAAAEERRIHDEQLWRIWKKASLPPEPANDFIRVRIRIPDPNDEANMRTVTRKFSTSAKVEDVYAFVECFDVDEGPSKEGHLEDMSNFDFVYAFRLVSQLPPRTIYDVKTDEPVGKAIGNMVTLNVERVDEEEDDEDEAN